jgi:F-type H+-transporting ATPase subunit b
LSKDKGSNRGLRRTLLLALWAFCLLYWSPVLRAQAQQPGESHAVENSSEPSENSHEMLFKIINFAILVGALGYLLRKPMAEFFGSRSDSIRKGLEEGRKALDASQAQLRAVGEKLARLEQEITSLKSSAAAEIQSEHERLRKGAAEEAQKIEEFARTQMDAAMRLARLELKKFTAQQAVALAADSIRTRLDEAGHRRLFTQFLADLEAGQNKN